MSQAKTFGERILARTPFGTRVEGVDVVMTLGDKACRMDYQTALKLSAFLRASAREAKRRAGDGSMILTVSADLTDGNLEDLEAERSRDGTAVFNRRH